MGIDNARLRRRYELRLKKILVVGIVIGVVGGILPSIIVGKVRTSIQKKKYETEITSLTKEKEKLTKEAKAKKETVEAANLSVEKLSSEDSDWSLVLVNESHPLDTGYTPEVAAITEGQFVDARIQEETAKMLEDAAAEGLNMYVVSAYRDYETQRGVFNTTMVDWINQGYSPLDAYDETKKSVAVPGTSEHATGLALDIVSSTYDALDEQQAETAEAKWLAENCWKYGFILRYPVSKSDVTGIVFEPWHYRYVGKDVAKEIMEQNITLEEYLEQ